ncbi:MAG: pilin [Candidatus Pacebacteria bacterium]|nr:pilin [Candidatus Paceibacterota bacterium]
MNNISHIIHEYLLVPVAHAQSVNGSVPDSVIEFIGRINQYLLNPVIVLMFAIALVTFIWGMFSFFGRKDNTEEIEKGKRHMLWGIIGMAIMVSVFGIMNFITSTTIGETTNPANSGDVSSLFN